MDYYPLGFKCLCLFDLRIVPGWKFTYISDWGNVWYEYVSEAREVK